MAKKANKHTDPIDNKTDAGKIKPCGYSVANIWSFHAKKYIESYIDAFDRNCQRDYVIPIQYLLIEKSMGQVDEFRGGKCRLR